MPKQPTRGRFVRVPNSEDYFLVTDDRADTFSVLAMTGPKAGHLLPFTRAQALALQVFDPGTTAIDDFVSLPKDAVLSWAEDEFEHWVAKIGRSRNKDAFKRWGDAMWGFHTKGSRTDGNFYTANRPEQPESGPTGPTCACGCGASTKGATFAPGHDQTLRARLEDRVGGLLALRELVDAAEKYVDGDAGPEDLGRAARRAFARTRRTAQ